MRAVDTNVLVRIVVRDDPAQTTAADAFVANGAWASHVVLAELTWVLASGYGFAPTQLALVLSMLLEHEHITIQDSDVARAALDIYQKGSVEFSDCLVLAAARKAGHLPLGTFDRRLSRLDGAELVR